MLAFVPMLLTSIGYSELNKADPDCGTTFTWAARAFGPRSGWAGGWAIVAADVLVMASLAQVAGQYVFLLFGANGIGTNPTSGWVLLVGVAWIVAMTYVCYRASSSPPTSRRCCCPSSWSCCWCCRSPRW
jgi:amino acid transporter